MSELDNPHDLKRAIRQRALTRARVARYRARRKGIPEPPPWTPGKCERCGARISAYAEAGSVLCSPCGGTKYPTHLAMIDALAHARGERPTVCKRGHDLDIHGTKSKRTGGRITIVCGECKRQRDAGYAKARRKRQAAPGYLTNCDPGDEQP